MSGGFTPTIFFSLPPTELAKGFRWGRVKRERVALEYMNITFDLSLPEQTEEAELPVYII